MRSPLLSRQGSRRNADDHLATPKDSTAAAAAATTAAAALLFMDTLTNVSCAYQQTSIYYIRVVYSSSCEKNTHVCTICIIVLILWPTGNFSLEQKRALEEEKRASPYYILLYLLHVSYLCSLCSAVHSSAALLHSCCER